MLFLQSAAQYTHLSRTVRHEDGTQALVQHFIDIAPYNAGRLQAAQQRALSQQVHVGPRHPRPHGFQHSLQERLAELAVMKKLSK